MKRSAVVVSVCLCLLPIALGLTLWDALPGEIAVHFSTGGAPDNYVPKWMAVIGLPILLALIDAYVIFRVANDPRGEGQSASIRRLSAWLCPVISNVAMPSTLFLALGKSVPMGMIVTAFAGVLIVTAGNYLPKCRQNYTIGIKLPWTLHDAENWSRTHRLAGFVWVAGGIILLLNAFLGGSSYVTIGVIVVLVGVPFVYSYALYRKKKREAA
ncbi:MAG: SdpI family protein [Eubacteriales bacterium]|nr:SdpI family protein [Eubacteriales bacterium]